MASNIVLYGTGLFGRDLPQLNQSQLSSIQQSGFTTVILWTLHVDPDGTLVYNDTVIVRDGIFANTFNYLQPLVQQLKAEGSTVKNVLFCIGDAGGDFQNIQTLLATPQGKLTLERNFSALSTALSIDGYDFDDEDLYSADVDTQLTNILRANNKMIITYCPYMSQNVWNDALKEVWGELAGMVGQPVRWWNLQCYSGGAGNDPLLWAQGLPENVGITDRYGFIVPGYDASVDSVDRIQQHFLRFAGSGINGGFIWGSTSVFDSPNTPADYANAIINGLAGVAPTNASEETLVTA
ncbi:MAG TPA: hypothetical protein VGF48_12850 [Thermoanaerobaculia bacterium]|jgi:hypothetical protein